MRCLTKKLSAAFSVIAAIVFVFTAVYCNRFPDSYQTYDTSNLIISNELFLSSDLSKDSINTPNNEYTANLKLFGVIPVKSVNVRVIENMQVALGGQPFGIKIFSKGVMVVGFTDILIEGKNVNPARKAGLRLGDVIQTIDGQEVSSNEDLSSLIKLGNGKTVSVELLRNKSLLSLTLTPIKSSNSDGYMAGIWVRDSCAGIGTMTFYSPVDGACTGLGHAVTDIDTNAIVPISNGEIMQANILSVNKGVNGDAGELCGSFINNQLGNLSYNCETGIYGTLTKYEEESELITIAFKQEVTTGKAQIYTSISNEGPKYYDCVIEQVDLNNKENHNMIIRITDDLLLKKSGGIVQGMSGSPIVQNGKLVGAVTHVFIDNASKGYAIFSETQYLQLKQAK